MLKNHRSLFLFFLFFVQLLFAQTSINPDSIEIIRDAWGVPHIYAKTDNEVGYGLAWAMSEDNFEVMQQTLLMSKGKLSSLKGKKNLEKIVGDYVQDWTANILQIDSLVAKHYDSDISPEYKRYIEAFAAGLNSYAAKHPEEVIMKGLFPVKPQDMMYGYAISMAPISNILPFDILYLFTNKTKKFEKPQMQHAPSYYGSNAFAIQKHRTKDNQTYFIANPHQPVEGSFAWYEAHLCSKEGLNIVGATFPGGMNIFVGTNDHLSWTHTLNYPNHSDFFKLKTSFFRPRKYQLDGKWEKMQRVKFSIPVRIGAITLKLPPFHKIYQSKFGIVVKNKGKFYAFRTPANQDLKAAEQWYKMNKATNYQEFRKALDWQGHPCMNIIYADKEDNIFHISNGKMPYRNKKHDWHYVVDGSKSETLWEMGKYYPVDSLPHLLNPPCGYLFSANHSPYNTTCTENNLKEKDFNPTMCYETYDNNRAIRFQSWINTRDKFSMEELLEIKYDQKFAKPCYSAYMMNIDSMQYLSPKKYPRIAKAIEVIKRWDYSADVNSTSAPLVIISANHLLKKYVVLAGRFKNGNRFTEKEMVKAIKFAQRTLKKHHGRIELPLGEVQLIQKGNKSYPMGGMMETLAPYFQVGPDKQGHFQPDVADTYIQVVKYKDGKPDIQSVMPFGASHHPESKHYNDQLDLYVQRKFKKMPLEKAEVLKSAERRYSPK
ncbi:MAG: penicillin acylase family protein [Bacteroidia bacterium]